MFERLFGAGARASGRQNFAIRQADEQRIDPGLRAGRSRRLQRRLAAADQQQARRIPDRRARDRAAASKRPSSSRTLPDPDVDTPPGIPPDFAEYMQLMYDMLLLAFQTDSTRDRHAAPGLRRQQPHVPEDRHPGRAPLPLAPPAAARDGRQGRRDRPVLHASIREVPGEDAKTEGRRRQLAAAQLDDRLRRRQLPTATATRTTTCRSSWPAHGGGALTPGRFLKAASQPMSNLFVTMLNRFGVAATAFGDSTGSLEQI